MSQNFRHLVELEFDLLHTFKKPCDLVTYRNDNKFHIGQRLVGKPHQYLCCATKALLLPDRDSCAPFDLASKKVFTQSTTQESAHAHLLNKSRSFVYGLFINESDCSLSVPSAQQIVAMVLSDYLEEEINEDDVLSRINTAKGRRDYNEAAEKIDEIRLTKFQERHLQEVDPISESDKLEIIRYAKEYLRLKDGAKATHFAKVWCSFDYKGAISTLSDAYMLCIDNEKDQFAKLDLLNELQKIFLEVLKVFSTSELYFRLAEVLHRKKNMNVLTTNETNLQFQLLLYVAGVGLFSNELEYSSLIKANLWLMRELLHRGMHLQCIRVFSRLEYFCQSCQTQGTTDTSGNMTKILQKGRDMVKVCHQKCDTRSRKRTFSELKESSQIKTESKEASPNDNPAKKRRRISSLSSKAVPPSQTQPSQHPSRRLPPPVHGTLLPLQSTNSQTSMRAGAFMPAVGRTRLYQLARGQPQPHPFISRMQQMVGEQQRLNRLLRQYHNALQERDERIKQMRVYIGSLQKLVDKQKTTISRLQSEKSAEFEKGQAFADKAKRLMEEMGNLIAEYKGKRRVEA